MNTTNLILSIGLLLYSQSSCFSQGNNKFLPFIHKKDCDTTKDNSIWVEKKVPNMKYEVICRYPVENQANFPGGKDSLAAFFKNNINWPSLDLCGQGTVSVSFIVDTLGIIRDSKILRGMCKSYDEEALRIVSIMPQWIPPNSADKRPIEVKMRIPIKFDPIK